MHITQPHRVQTCDAAGSEQALGHLSLHPKPLKRFNLKKTCINVGTWCLGYSKLPCGVPPGKATSLAALMQFCRGAGLGA